MHTMIEAAFSDLTPSLAPMMSASSKKLIACLSALVLAAPALADAAGFQDILDAPAKTSALAQRSLVNGLAAAGQRAVAVGQRGHILYSDDKGKSWRQAVVPVSSDLVAVAFPTPAMGWAVGHDGVILHTSDGGATWSKQMDGRRGAELLVAYYTAKAGSGALGGQAEADRLIDEIRRLAAQGPENPFLDVWFADARTGFVVGAFNLIFRTDDGGKTWEPWFDRTDNPTRLHFYAIRGAGDDVYIAGEQGLVLKLDRQAGLFRRIDTPYKGTFFGVIGSDASVIVHGLRGNAYRSIDGGRTWQKIETGLQDGITAGAAGSDGRVVIASQAGRILSSDDGGASFSMVKLTQSAPASAALFVDAQTLLVGGTRGLRIQPLR